MVYMSIIQLQENDLTMKSELEVNEKTGGVQ
jgi:hypothetical protein